MSQGTTVHLAVVEVDTEEEADVSLHGDELAAHELMEYADVQTLLQRELTGERALELGVTVEPQSGLQALDL